MTKFQKILKKRVAIFDGATGTELQRHGMPQGVCPEMWCLKNPEVLAQVHHSYLKSGSDIISTATFGANRLKLNSYRIKSVNAVNRDLVRIARKAVGHQALIAGDIGPTGHFIEPFGSLSFHDAVNIFKEQIQGLIDGGVDLFIIETMMDIQEARAALLAVRELSHKEVFVTLTFEKNNRTLNGTDALSAAITLESLGATAVGCNCSSGPQEMIPLVRQMRKIARIPLIVKPNAGIPVLSKGKAIFPMTAQSFASHGKRLMEAGASVLGGCCGTNPEHIAGLSRVLKMSKPLRRAQKHLSAVSSAQGHVVFDFEKNPVIIGECINPTGRSALREELKQGKTALVRELAFEQKTDGAQLLDVNAGVAGMDETILLPKVIGRLSVLSPLPLVMDTSNPLALEKALRLYPGRALINSISGEGKKMSQMLAIAKKYGAMFILLPVAKNLPRKFSQRRVIIKRILKRAIQQGFSKKDILVDGLVMTVASHRDAAQETLKTIRFCHQGLKVKTVCGLSNVSFGMPQRTLLNNSFFALLKESGLSSVIADPKHLRAKKSKFAIAVLNVQDERAQRYIAHCQSRRNTRDISKTHHSLDLRQNVYESITQGDSQDLRAYLRSLVRQMPAAKIVDKIIIPAMNEVGERFERKEYFLPQLIASAEVAQEAFYVLKPLLKSHPSKVAHQAVVILATVKGDIHDIGKNIVALMLKNHGFKVIDLGKNVSSKKIVEEAARHKNPIIGLSALMTTTMIHMKDVIALAKERNLHCCFMIGGAVVTKEYARLLGASYSRDGVEAVRVASRLAQHHLSIV